jgi:hypothetical protein
MASFGPISVFDVNTCPLLRYVASLDHPFLVSRRSSYLCVTFVVFPYTGIVDKNRARGPGACTGVTDWVQTLQHCIILPPV